MIERIGAFNGTRFIPIDDEEMTALELIGKISDATNKLIDSNNSNELAIQSLEKEKVFHDEMPVKYKLERQGDSANFTGSWFGLSKPTLSQEGATAQVEKNTLDLELRRKNTVLYNNFLYKLRKLTENINITCMGDSITYGSDFNSTNKRPAATTTTDNGINHTATRAAITYPEVLERELNKIYTDRIKVKNNGYSGDGTQLGYNHWNASGSDLCVISYGINDAINENIDYYGNVEEYLKWYRLIIEREINNNTPIILITPSKQLLASPQPNDGRLAVDTFANAVLMLGKEYNIPVVDGNLLVEGYDASIYSDATHFNDEGYTIFASNMIGLFVGDGANNPHFIDGYTMLGANILFDNFMLTGNALIANSGNYPSPGEYVNGTSPAIFLKDGGSVTYSFYTTQNNMVVVPALYTSSKNCNVKMELNRNVRQANVQNYFYSFNTSDLSKTKINKSYATILNDDLVDISKTVYSLKNLYNTSQPYLIINKKGWNTITVTTNFGDTDSCSFYGIEFITFNDFLNRTITEIEVPLLNCEAFDSSRTPKLLINNSRCELVGTIKNIQQSSDNIIFSIDTEYAPKYNCVFTTAISSGSAGGYTIINITPSGKGYITYKSDANVNYTNLFGCTWFINEQ